VEGAKADSVSGMLDRVMWVVVAAALAAMAISLWSDARVASFGAGSAAAYSMVAAGRGRCVAGACVPPASGERATAKK
jgi:hypothetical protein